MAGSEELRGQEAEDAVSTLSTELQDGIDQIQTAFEGASTVTEVLNAGSVATSTIATMWGEVTSTFTTLEGLDASRVVSISPCPASRSPAACAIVPTTSMRAVTVSCGRWLMNAINRSWSDAGITVSDTLAEMVDRVGEDRAGMAATGPFDVAVFGLSDTSDPDRVARYAAGGATWWFESLSPMRGPVDALLAIIEAGPPGR